MSGTLSYGHLPRDSREDARSERSAVGALGPRGPEFHADRLCDCAPVCRGEKRSSSKDALLSVLHKPRHIKSVLQKTKKKKRNIASFSRKRPRVCLVREKIGVACFDFIWQLLSNYGVISLKRFVSSFTTKLCN